MNQTNPNSTTRYSVAVAHTCHFRRSSAHVYLFNVLDVIQVEGDNGDTLSAPLVLRRPLRDLAVVSIVSDNSVSLVNVASTWH